MKFQKVLVQRREDIKFQRIFRMLKFDVYSEEIFETVPL